MNEQNELKRCAANLFGAESCTCVQRWSPQAKQEECGNYTGEMYADHRGEYYKVQDVKDFIPCIHDPQPPTINCGTFTAEAVTAKPDTIQSLRATIAAAKEAIEAKEARISELREALNKIADPIAFLRQEALASDAQLIGSVAVQVSEDANWLKSVAREALAILAAKEQG